MPRLTSTWLALSIVAMLPGVALRAQVAPMLPPPADPARPQTRAERDRREAVKLYAVALLQERESRLVEATHTLEEALRLDAESSSVRKALVPLYLSLDRTTEALKLCREALDLDPGDYSTWHVYARQLKALGRSQEAAAALEQALGCQSLKEEPAAAAQMRFELASLYETLQDFVRASQAFAAVAAALEQPEAFLEKGHLEREDIATQAAEAYERLGRACVQAGQPERAIVAYRRAQEKDPNRGKRLAFNLAEVYQKQGRFTDALASVEDYLTSQPAGTEAYEMKVALLRRLRREGLILPELRRHAAVDSENQALQLLLAREYGTAGFRKEAEALYQQLARRSAHVDIYRGLFTLYRDEGKTGGARILQLFDETVAAASDDAPDKAAITAQAARGRAMLVVLRGDASLFKAMLPAIGERLQSGAALQHETRRFLAALAARARQLPEAERLYRSCLSSGAGRKNEPEVYAGLLRVLWLGHKYEDIVALCRQGLDRAQATNRVMFQIDLGRALMYLGRVEEALKQADEAVEIAGDGERLLARRNRALLLADAGRHEEAVAACQEMLRDHTAPDDVREVRYTLSQVHSIAKNYPGSEEQLELIRTAHPDDATAHNDLGYIWADQGKRLEEAERLIRRALELDREQRSSGKRLGLDADEANAAYVDSLGWVLFRRGRLEEARVELEKAVALPGGDDDPTVWDHLGDVYARLGLVEKAAVAWRKALELYDTGKRRPTDDRYKDIKGKLQMPAVSAPGR